MLSSEKKLRVAWICGMVVPVVAFSCILISISLSPWFSWTKNALSDLGVGEASWVFNFGLMASGTLTMIFAVGLWVTFRKRVLGRVGTIALFFGAIALFGIGVFSEAAGVVHFYFSVAFFVLFPISFFLLGASAILSGSGKFGSFTILMGIFAAIPWTFSWDGVAIPEAISGLFASIWVIWEGVRLYLGREKS